MARKEVWFVMKDPGGTNNVLPVARKMRELYGDKVNVDIFGDTKGKAPEILNKASEIFEAGDSLLQFTYIPALVVSSMCSGDNNLGQQMVSEFKDQCPTIVMPDSPWGRFEKEWNDPKYYPTWLIINDATCSLLNVQNVWRQYDPTKIKILSWPFLDKYWKFNLAPATEAVNKLCDYAGNPIVTFLGQLNGTSNVLKEVIMALNAINIPISFIPRFHPRCSDEEKATCQEVLKRFDGIGLIKDSSILDTSTIIAGSDVVVSVYSLSLIEAAALRKQTISVITEAGYKMFRDDIGEKMIPDFGNAGYAYEVHNLAELTIALQKAINGKLRRELLPKQKAALTVDGKNAERVAKFIAHNILGI